MKYLIYLTIGILINSCTKDNIPDICDDLGYNPNPNLFKSGFLHKWNLEWKEKRFSQWWLSCFF